LGTHGVALRPELSLDLLKAPDPGFHFGQHDGRSREEGSVHGATARKRELELRPPAPTDERDQPVHKPGVPRVVDQGRPLSIELHAEVGAEDCAGSRPNGRTDARVAPLEPRNDRSIDTDRGGNRSLGDAGPQSELAEVLGEAERGSTQFTIALRDHQAPDAGWI